MPICNSELQHSPYWLHVDADTYLCDCCRQWGVTYLCDCGHVAGNGVLVLLPTCVTVAGNRVLPTCVTVAGSGVLPTCVTVAGSGVLPTCVTVAGSGVLPVWLLQAVGCYLCDCCRQWGVTCVTVAGSGVLPTCVTVAGSGVLPVWLLQAVGCYLPVWLLHCGHIAGSHAGDGWWRQSGVTPAGTQRVSCLIDLIQDTPWHWLFDWSDTGHPLTVIDLIQDTP